MAETPLTHLQYLFLDPFQKKAFWDTNHGVLLFPPYAGENLKEKTKKMYGLCSTWSIKLS